MRPLTHRLTLGLAMAALGGLAPAPLLAHHSFAMYDQSVRYVFTGVVERVNPDAGHLQIFFVPLDGARKALLRDASGERLNWVVEMAGSRASAQEGITVNSFPRGTVFSVGLMPLRNGQRGGARVEALFKCPPGKAPASGLHCDSVEGATAYGKGGLPKPTANWTP